MKTSKKKKGIAFNRPVSRSKNGGVKSTRIYLEKKYFTKKEGGGSFFTWIDMEVSENKIEISRLHSMGEGKSKKELPTDGSGSGESYGWKEAKVLIRLLQKGIKLMKRK